MPNYVVDPSQVTRVCFRTHCPNCGYNPKGQPHRVERRGDRVVVFHNRCGYAVSLEEFTGEQIDWDTYVARKIGEGYVLWPGTGHLWAHFDLLPMEWEVIEKIRAQERKAQRDSKRKEGSFWNRLLGKK